MGLSITLQLTCHQKQTYDTRINNDPNESTFVFTSRPLDKAHLHHHHQNYTYPNLPIYQSQIHHLNLRENPQRSPRLLLRLLNQPTHSPKLLMLRIAQNLKQHTLATRHHSPRIPQPRQRNPPLLGVNTTHPINEHVHPMPTLKEIERRLRDADMRLDADDDHVQRFAVAGREEGIDLGRYH